MKVLLLQAYTGSEWDSVSFALIEIDEAHQAYLKKIIQRQTELKAEGIDKLVVSADNADFFIDEEQLPEICFNEFNEIQEGVYDLSEELIDELTRPEQDLKYGEMVFSHDSVTFKIFGKHTDEESWTNSISFNEKGELVDECKNPIPQLTPIS